MKKLIYIAVISMFIAPTAFAATNDDSIGRVKLVSSAILVTNPFYQTKNVFAGIKGFFIFNPLSKVQFNLELMDDKASETLKLTQIAPDNVTALVSALSEYQGSVIQLRSSFNRFLSAQNSAAAWEPIADRLLLHLNFTDDLLATVSSNTAKALLVNINDLIQRSLIQLLTRFDKVDAWIDTTVSVESDFAFSDLRTAERLRDLADKAQELEDTVAADKFWSASETLMETIADRIADQLSENDELVISDLARVSGAPAGRLRSIEQLIEYQPSLGRSSDLDDLIAKLAGR